MVKRKLTIREQDFLLDKLQWHQRTRIAFTLFLFAANIILCFVMNKVFIIIWIVIFLLFILTIFQDYFTRDRKKTKNKGLIFIGWRSEPTTYLKSFPIIPILIDLVLFTYLLLLTGGIYSVFTPTLLVIGVLGDFCLTERMNHDKRIVVKRIILIFLVVGCYVLVAYASWFPNVAKDIASLGNIVNITQYDKWINWQDININKVKLTLFIYSSVYYGFIFLWTGHVLHKVSLFVVKTVKPKKEIINTE